MPCYHPIRVWRKRSGRDPKTGSWPITFNMREGYQDMPLEIPCGQCIGCRLERSRQWGVRCLLEAEMHEKNCFITLTYDDEHIPENNSLQKRDYVLFIKSLRKKAGIGLRYFLCGEYGQCCARCGLSKVYCACEKFEPSLGRPHFHACLFGYDFEDKVPLELPRYRAFGTTATFYGSSEAGGCNGGGRPPLFRSETLEGLWKKGYSTIGEVTFESACYVGRYCVKKITGEQAERHYGDREPEFCQMSRRPGIAFKWFEKYYEDVAQTDKVIVRSDNKIKAPKYYDEYMKKIEPRRLKAVKGKRKDRARENAENNDWKRLRVRERLQIIRFKKLKRSMENE